MNGEVIAWVVDPSGEPVDGWLLLSDDCSVRAPVHNGQAMTLSPPGECRFRVAPSAEAESHQDDWITRTVFGSDTILIEFVVGDPSAHLDTGT